MSDVARRAGVSRATASYVLNRTPGARIPEQTRAKVLAAAEDLRYVPHVSARSLRRGRSDLVIGHVDGNLVARAGLPFAGIAQVAADIRRSGYTFLFHGDPTVSGIPAARAWLALRPAAVIAALDRYTRESVAMLAEAGTAAVAVSHRPSDIAATVVLDDGALGRAAAETLVAGGRRRIAVVGVAEEPADELALGNRPREALRAAEAGGATAELVRMVPGPAAARAVVGTWRAAGRLPDGIVGSSTAHAGHLLVALVDAGIRVPDDVAVIAADDSPLCELLRPRLTSVVAEVTAGSARMADHVLAAIEGRWDPAAAGRRLGAHVVPRESA